MNDYATAQRKEFISDTQAERDEFVNVQRWRSDALELLERNKILSDYAPISDKCFDKHRPRIGLPMGERLVDQ